MPTHHAQIEPVSLQQTTLTVKSALPPLKSVTRGTAGSSFQLYAAVFH